MNAALGLSTAVTRQVLTAAGLGPSSNGTQPWRLRLERDRIEIHAAPGRQPNSADPEDRQFRLACGTVLLNLRLALQASGITPLVDIDRHDGGAVAVVGFGGPSTQSRAEADLYRAIGGHQSCGQFQDMRVPPSYRRLLLRAALDEDAVLHAATDPTEQMELGRILAAADRRGQASDRAESQAGACEQLRRADLGTRACVAPGSEPPDLAAYLDPGRDRFRGRHADTEPFVAVLATRADNPADQVRAGQALQRVLLTATTLGLTAAFLARPIVVPECRRDLRRMLADRLCPQLVLRLGFGCPSAPTLRRDLGGLATARILVAAR